MCKLPPPHKVAAGDKARIRGAPGGTTLEAQRGVNNQETQRKSTMRTCRAPSNGAGRKEVAEKEQRKAATANKDKATPASSGRSSRATSTRIA